MPSMKLDYVLVSSAYNIHLYMLQLQGQFIQDSHCSGALAIYANTQI